MTPAEQAAILRRGFKAHELEWKLMTVGKSTRGIWARCVPYIDARAVIVRLDEAFGPMGYSVTYEPITIGNSVGMKCRIAAGEVVREDVSEASDIEPLKGAASGALKRAFVQFGGGAYLYDSPDFYATIGGADSQLPRYGQTKEKEKFRWDIPPEAYEWVAATSGEPVSAPASGTAASPARGTSGSPAPSPAASSAASGVGQVLMPGKETHFKNWATRPIIDVPNDVLKEAFDYLTVKADSPTNKFKEYTLRDLATVKAEMDRRQGSDDGDPGPEQPEGLDEGDDFPDDLPF